MNRRKQLADGTGIDVVRHDGGCSQPDLCTGRHGSRRVDVWVRLAVSGAPHVWLLAGDDVGYADAVAAVKRCASWRDVPAAVGAVTFKLAAGRTDN